MKLTHLPPNCGADLDVPLLFNPYQQAFQEARRQRYCLTCKTIGMTALDGLFTCAKCGTVHYNNLTAPRVFDQLLVLAGRGGGKTLIGAHAVREEALVPNGIIWVMGPTFKVLHDSTFPTLIRLIPPDWVKKWDAEHMELTLHNNTLIAFRSLEDPERARGPHGVTCGWFDEAAQCPERAYDVFKPTLIKAGGIVIATTTVLGYDWTYKRIEQPAQVENTPGFWSCKYWTEENPLFRSNPTMMRKIEADRRSMTPEFFAQEYHAERHNATGLIYNYQKIAAQVLTDEQVKQFIPEWPKINPDRQILIGLDSGSDHPFGAVLMVVTEFGIICIDEYLQRMRAVSEHLPAIRLKFGLARFDRIRYMANKNEANLRLEWGLKHVGVQMVEAKHEIGIQRVQSWLLSGQLYFVGSRCPKTIEQMRAYRYAENTQPDGQKKEKERVFKMNDELPDAIRYALMGWPSLPQPTIEPSVITSRDIRKLDAQTRFEIERMHRIQDGKETRDLEPADRDYPLGDFNGITDEEDGYELFGGMN